MKLFGKFREHTIQEIMLTSVPEGAIKEFVETAKTNSKIEIIVKEYKPRKKLIRETENEKKYLQPIKENRHQVVVKNKQPYMTMLFYSIPLNHKQVEWCGLTPISTVIAKEKTQEAIYKMQGNKGIYKEYITVKK